MVVDHPVIAAGGGTLHGGGPILTHPDGTITHIPPGDPFEKEARLIVARNAEALIEEVKRMRDR